MSMTDAERETVIVFDKESGLASVYTFEQKIMTRMEKEMDRLTQAGGRMVESGKFEGSPYARYEVPKAWVKVTPPKRMESRKGKPVGKKGKE